MDTSKEKPTNYYIITNDLKMIAVASKVEGRKGAAASFLQESIDKNYR